MKNRYWLFRRNGIYYLQDAQTRHKESLRTSDRGEAHRIRAARNEAAEKPNLGIALAKAYLCARDPQIAQRTWQTVLDAFCARGKPQTQAHRRRVAGRKHFDTLRSQNLLETTASEFLNVLENGGVMTHTFLRCVHNLAVGLGWLPWPVLPPKLWPALNIKPKRGVTAEEHQQILAAEKNPERRRYYQLLWETGASQSDAACLRADNIDWENRLLSYQRQKTGEWAHLKIGNRLEALLRELPSEGLLFPSIGKIRNSARSAEFCRRCRILKIKGVSLHSYRYAWAERAKTCGYPERFAQQALGHGSKAVHRAYAKNAKVLLPPLELFEQNAKTPTTLDLSSIEDLPPQTPQAASPKAGEGAGGALKRGIRFAAERSPAVLKPGKLSTDHLH
jgi:integrase